MSIQQQVQMVAAMLAKHETISIAATTKLLALLDRAPAEALELLVCNRVKFAWMPAARRLQEKFGYTREQVKALVK